MQRGFVSARVAVEVHHLEVGERPHQVLVGHPELALERFQLEPLVLVGLHVGPLGGFPRPGTHVVGGGAERIAELDELDGFAAEFFHLGLWINCGLARSLLVLLVTISVVLKIINVRSCCVGQI